VALGAVVGIWGAINFMEGYGNDNPGAKSQGMKQLMAGGGVACIGTTFVLLLSYYNSIFIEFILTELKYYCCVDNHTSWWLSTQIRLSRRRKMNNIILDTNAFIYLMNIEKGKKNTICIEKRLVDDQVFYNLCRDANHLFVTGQTLYELFWQSIENTGDIFEFAILYDAIAKYRRIYGIKFSVLNDADGIFDLKLFQEQFQKNAVDIKYFVEEKRKYECAKLERLLFTIYVSAMGAILDCYGADIPKEYYDGVKDVIHVELDRISNAYYVSPSTKNELYDKSIEAVLGTVWKATVDMLRDAGKEQGIVIPDNTYNDSGSDYMHRLFCKIKRVDDKIFKRFDDFLDEMGENLKKNGDPTESVLYLKRLCKRSIYSGAKIRKNDGLDYSIMTCLAKENVVNETDSSVDLNNTFSLTFDANLYRFSKENSVLYKKEIYDELLK